MAGPEDVAVHLTVGQLALLLQVADASPHAFINSSATYNAHLEQLMGYGLVRHAIHPKGAWKITNKGRALARIYRGHK